MSANTGVTVVIATRNRAASLARCVASLEALGAGLDEVIVVDDGSPQAIEPALRAAIHAAMNARVRVIRFDPQRGLAAARNTGVREARSSWVLHLDDDTVLLSTAAVDDAVRVLAGDRQVFAVAFAQALADGAPLPPAAQPARSTRPCYTASYIGFAHLVRRETFLPLGGYREQLVIHGEERELCLRALDAGHRVVYLPDARIAHLADPAGRDMRRYLHLTVRNGVLASIYNDPFLLMFVRVTMRLRAYFVMRRGWAVDDPGGWWTVLRCIGRDLRLALAQRHPVRWRTLREWRRLVREAPPYLEGVRP